MQFRQSHLGNSLAGAHDAARVNRLVRGNHHKTTCIIFAGHPAENPCAESVGTNRLAGVAFHQRHVLVGRRMKNDVGAPPGKDFFHRSFISDIGNYRHKFDLTCPFPQFFQQSVNRKLAMAKQNQRLRRIRQNLADNFAADRSPRTGDQHDTTAKKLADPLCVKHDGIPGQQVLETNLAQFVQSDRAVREFLQRGQNADGNLQGQKFVQKLADSGNRGGRQRHQNVADPLGSDNADQLVERPENGNAGDRLLRFGRIVVEKTDDVEVRIMPFQVASQKRARFPGADDQRLPRRTSVVSFQSHPP